MWYNGKYTRTAREAEQASQRFEHMLDIMGVMAGILLPIVYGIMAYTGWH